MASSFLFCLVVFCERTAATVASPPGTRAAQGRYPHQSWLKQWSKEDERAVEKALEITGVLELADRPLDTLSGGQRQRAWISMALA